MKYLYFFFFIAFSAHSQIDSVKGVVIPKVDFVVEDTLNYAGYFPREYKDSKVYPAVLIFDKAGRGGAAVQQFTIAAALTKSMVFGANYELEENHDVAFNQVKKLIAEVKSNYAVNEDKIILVGNDQNASILSAFAQSSTDIHGVIAINDLDLKERLLMNHPELKIVLITGDENKDFYKLKSYQKNRKFKDVIIDFKIFNGFVWPPAGYLSGALTDLLLDNNTSTLQVEDFYASDLAFGDLLYKRQNHLYAYDFIYKLKKKYKKYINLDSQKKLLKKIKSNQNYRVKKNEFTIVDFTEMQMAQDLQYFLTEDVKHAYFENLGWWSSQMDALDGTIDSISNAPLERKAAIRLKGLVQNSVEKKYKKSLLKNTSLESALFLNILRTLVNPQNQDALINVIALSAKEGDYNAAYFYLEELLKTDYKDFDMLYKIPNTKAIVIGPEWNEIVKSYLGKSRYY